MPAHKRQHYVPRCYLRLFSSAGSDNAINLYNIDRDRSIQHAPLKGQCARDYIYGEDLELERRLQEVEGKYAAVIRKLIDEPNKLSLADLKFLRFFAHLQYARTEMAAKRIQHMEGDVVKAIHEGRAVAAPELDLSDRTMMLASMAAMSDLGKYIINLKMCIVRNNTKCDFITSDDPAIYTNKFHLQRLGRRNFGLGSSGTLLFLPLTPRYSLICYDGAVYTLPAKKGQFLEITKDTDSLALNELQYLKAAKNIYFSSWEDEKRIAQEFAECRERRPETQHLILVYVREHVTGAEETYRLATEEERRTAQHLIINTRSDHNAPARWLSELKYRIPIRTYSNGAAVGHVRNKEWLERKSLEDAF
jgi:hypothetical protein